MDIALENQVKELEERVSVLEKTLAFLLSEPDEDEIDEAEKWRIAHEKAKARRHERNKRK